MRGPRIAFEGCGHGTLHSIYASVNASCEAKQWDSVDLLIIGGDFQAVRNGFDLNCMAVPIKYRELGDFHEYYSGARVAPYLTLFVGGNHEASNYLQELHYGGWVAPNIYYLGVANVLRLGPLRIAGISGIWKGYDYRKPHHERLPYSNDDVRSVFHVREMDTRKLLQMRSQVDLGLSHDWPNGVEWMGDWKQLFRFKPYFQQDANEGKLGNKAARYLLDWLRPPYWFSAHMHAKYVARVHHENNAPTPPTHDLPAPTIVPQPNVDELSLDLEDEGEALARPHSSTNDSKNATGEIDLDLDETEPKELRGAAAADAADSKVFSAIEAAEAELPASFSRPKVISNETLKLPEPETTIDNNITEFLALDKCLPGRRFLQLQEFSNKPLDSDSTELQLSYDVEWLAITRAFANIHEYSNPRTASHQDKGRGAYALTIDEEMKWVEENIVTPAKLNVPLNFVQTAPIYNPDEQVPLDTMPREYNNSQTAAYCELLGIPNAFHASEEEIVKRASAGPPPDSRPQNSNRGGRGWGQRGRGGGRGGGRGMHRGFRGRGRGT